MRERVRTWVMALLVAAGASWGVLQITHLAMTRYPDGWWQYAHMVALWVALQLFFYRAGLARRWGIKPWISVGLAIVALSAWVIYPLLRWGM